MFGLNFGLFNDILADTVLSNKSGGLMAKKISVINFKGGVGKTTLAFHLACYLAKEARVLVVDVDHQSSLSIVMMGGPWWEKVTGAGSSCNRIFQSYCNRKVPMPGVEIIVRNPLGSRPTPKRGFERLDLVPAQFELDDTEIELAATTGGSPTVSEWQKRVLLAEWLSAINADSEYDYIIFDCPPATKLVSQNALAASDFYLVPVVPDAMSSRGVTHFRRLVHNKIDLKLEFLRNVAPIPKEDVPSCYVPNSQLAGIAPFMAKIAGAAYSGLTNIHTEQLAYLRREWKSDLLKTVVTDLTGVAEAMDAGLPVWSAYQTGNIEKAVPMMDAVCAEIVGRL